MSRTKHRVVIKSDVTVVAVAQRKGLRQAAIWVLGDKDIGKSFVERFANLFIPGGLVSASQESQFIRGGTVIECWMKVFAVSLKCIAHRVGVLEPTPFAGLVRKDVLSDGETLTAGKPSIRLFEKVFRSFFSKAFGCEEKK